jgi:hypothetical protein
MSINTNNADASEWQPAFARWRHGGWYVTNIRHTGGAVGCVSNNYPDKKWRIVCDERRQNLGEDGDFTFPDRHSAARAEYELAKAKRDLATREVTKLQ